jgi:cytochrome P450
MGIWLLTRYADVVAALKDEHLSASARHWKNYRNFFSRDRLGIPSRMSIIFDKWMLQLDPPDHTRLRALVNKAFTPRAVQRMRPRIEGIIDKLLAAALAQGELDVVEALSVPLPIIVIAAMLGVPEVDWRKIQTWSIDLLPFFNAGTPLVAAQRVSVAAECLCDYFLSLAAERRRHPQDDLLSALIAATDAHDRLSETELLGTCTLLALAGHATTSQLVGNLFVAMARHPEQRALAQADPRLIPAAIEETLRYEAPLQVVTRSTIHPTTIGGQRIEANQFIWVSLPAANRDPAQFPDPDRFDITRHDNRHVAFGYGCHYCAGAPLARLEGQIVLEYLLKHLKNLELIAPVEREPSMLLRGLKRVRVSFTPSSATM